MSYISVSEPLSKLSVLFRNSKKEDVSFVNEQQVTFEDLLKKEKASPFFAQLTKLVVEYNQVNNELVNTFNNNKLIYNSLYGILIALIAATLALVAYALNKKVQSGEIDIMKSVMSTTRFTTVALIFITCIAFLINVTSVLRSRQIKLEKRMYTTELDNPYLNSLVSLSSFKNGTFYGNYILFIYYRLYHNKDAVFEEDVCEQCEENTCSTLQNFLTGCDESFTTAHTQSLVSIVNGVFDKLDTVEQSIRKLDPVNQLDLAKDSFTYVQQFILRASNIQEDMGVMPEQEMQQLFENELKSILILQFVSIGNLRPIFEQERRVSTSNKDTMTKSQCIKACLDDDNCSACFYDDVTKCTLYTKQDLNERAVFNVEYDPESKSDAVFKRSDLISSINIKGCIPKSEVERIKKDFKTGCIDSQCDSYIQLKPDSEKDKIRKYFPKHSSELQIGAAIRFTECLPQSTSVNIVRLQSDITTEAVKYGILRTLKNYRQILAEMMVDKLIPHGSKVDLKQTSAFFHTELSRYYGEAKYQPLKDAYSDIFDSASSMLTTHWQKLNEQLQPDDKSKYITFEQFRAKLSSMSELEFIDVFCRHFNAIRVSSDSLYHFHTKVDFHDHQQTRNLTILKICIIYSAILMGLGIVYYGLNDDVFYQFNILKTSTKYIGICGLFATIVCMGYAIYKNKEVVFNYNSKISLDNGSTIVNISSRLCRETLLLHTPRLANKSRLLPCLVEEDIASTSDIDYLRNQCHGQVSASRMIQLNETHSQYLQDMYSSMIDLSKAIEQCNHVLKDSTTQIPFPYASLTINALMVTICVLAIMYILTNFNIIGRLGEIKKLNTIKYKLERYIPVPDTELKFFTSSNPIDIGIQRFLVILGIIVFVFFTSSYSSKLVSSANSLNTGLFNSKYFQQRKCYK